MPSFRWRKLRHSSVAWLSSVTYVISRTADTDESCTEYITCFDRLAPSYGLTGHVGSHMDWWRQIPTSKAVRKVGAWQYTYIILSFKQNSCEKNMILQGIWLTFYGRDHRVPWSENQGTRPNFQGTRSNFRESENRPLFMSRRQGSIHFSSLKLSNFYTF